MGEQQWNPGTSGGGQSIVTPFEARHTDADDAGVLRVPAGTLGVDSLNLPHAQPWRSIEHAHSDDAERADGHRSFAGRLVV